MNQGINSLIRGVLAGELWAMETSAYVDLPSSIADAYHAGGARAAFGLSRPAPASARIAGTSAVISISGPITQRPNFLNSLFGGVSCQEISSQLYDALRSPMVKSIILDIDSPGGTVGGVEELARQIYGAREGKPIIAVVNSTAASAAYWIAASCSKIAVTPSGQVGSIGVFSAHHDVSQALAKAGIKPTLISAGKYKTEGNPYEALSDDARRAMQGAVDDYYDLFTRSVAKGRGVSVSAVRSGFGEGRMVPAQAAVKNGMADRIFTMDQVLAGTGKNANRLAASANAQTMTRVGDMNRWVRLLELEASTDFRS